MLLAFFFILSLLSGFYRLLTDGRLRSPGFIVVKLALLFARLRPFGVSIELLADGFFERSLSLEGWFFGWISFDMIAGVGSLAIFLGGSPF